MHYSSSLVTVFFLLLFQIAGSQDIGANYNEGLSEIDPQLIDDSNVKWVRGFVNMSNFLRIENQAITDVRRVAIDNFDGIDNLKAASQVPVEGGGTVKVIFSLKFQFKAQDVGPPVDATERELLREAVFRLLDKENIWEHIDILVVGNEPMWETPDNQTDIDLLVTWTNYIIDELFEYRSNNANVNFKIYAGALNRYSSLTSNSIRNAILNIAKNNSKVEGLDIHSHVMNFQELQNDVSYIRDVENFTKEIIFTEFSLHRLLQSKLNDNLGSWGIANGYSSTMKLYEWINTYLEAAENATPKSKAEFLDYFNSQSWYPQNWFEAYFQGFCNSNVTAATYGFTRFQDPPNFRLEPDSPAWVLNAIYNDALFGKPSDGYDNTNPINFSNFNAIMTGVSTCNNLSIDELQNLDVVIYPNPSKGILNIKFNSVNDFDTIDILTVYGQKLMSMNIESTKQTIDLSSFSSGLYVFSFKNNSKSLIKKIIIN